jgi:hypothetical protein
LTAPKVLLLDVRSTLVPAEVTKRATIHFDGGPEWHALILGLRMALKHGERHVVVKGDSLLVVKQINGDWKTKNAALQSLIERFGQLFVFAVVVERENHDVWQFPVGPRNACP